MRVIVIPDDKLIGVDGEFRTVDIPYDVTIHAIQWYGDHGEIEYKIGGSSFFENIDRIQPYVAAWEAAAPPAPDPPK